MTWIAAVLERSTRLRAWPRASQPARARGRAYQRGEPTRTAEFELALSRPRSWIRYELALSLDLGRT